MVLSIIVCASGTLEAYAETHKTLIIGSNVYSRSILRRETRKLKPFRVLLLIKLFQNTFPVLVAPELRFALYVNLKDYS
jgi:hypothetical protein